ncbi:MAG TPA: alpha/beta hydrolase, partial [Candidatus Acidoferrum sp.]|nr:alpha/beta hydrolase [Candidatus Acidoferrum sp.]
MAEVPETRFAKLGGDRIAYQVVGEGPLDLLYTGQGGDAMDARWEWPPYIKFLNRLASFSRLIMFDPRGVGASDSISFEGLPPWEQWADDVRTVLDAVDSERATLLGGGDTGAAAILFAATEPERTSALMLFSASARFVVTDDYPWGLPEELSDDVMRHMVESWGTEAIADILAPTMAGDLAFRRWFAKASRGSHSPRGAARYFQVVQGLDVRHVLPLVRVPTLVLHPEDSS